MVSPPWILQMEQVATSKGLMALDSILSKAVRIWAATVMALTPS